MKSGNDYRNKKYEDYINNGVKTLHKIKDEQVLRSRYFEKN